MNNKSLVMLSLAVLAAGCAPKKAEEAVVAETLPSVKVIDAVRENVPQDAVYSATIQANIVNNIVPQTASRIKKINVEVGDFVKEGQILAEMDRVQLEQAELRLKNDETELGRIKQLYSEGGISQSDYESLELAYKVSKSSYQNLLDNTILRAPVSGVVTARNYDRGDMYAMAQPIFTVQQITPVKILVAISETDYTRVKKGDKVSITADALPGQTFEGSVIRLYPIMDSSSHTFTVEVQVRNENRVLRPGMYARVTVKFGENNSVVLPDAAVVKQQGSGQRAVYVVNGDVAELRVVTPGRHFDGKYEILSGVEAGEKVVVKGQSSLKSGVKVEVI
ncbi:MAG: efflux RND transporter periplasmic adaptor subunit [Bacteroidales bacterium]|nr:efflux RND transporter periplasmic adaptor subunit [Candidatus Cryptobacteroides equifaecalis]